MLINDNKIILDIIKENTRILLKESPILKWDKINNYELFLKVIFGINNAKYNDLSMIFDVFEIFLKYLLTNTIVKWEQNVYDLDNNTIKKSLEEIFNSNIIFNTLYAYEHNLVKIKNIKQSWKVLHVIFEQNFQILNKDKFIYTTMSSYPISFNKYTENKIVDNFWDAIDCMFTFDKKLLTVKVDKYWFCIWDILNIFKSLMEISFINLTKLKYIQDLEILVFNSKINIDVLVKQIKEIIFLKYKVNYRTKAIKSIICQLSYDVNLQFSINNINNIDFKAKPLLIYQNYVYIPYSLMLILNIERSFLSFISKEYSWVFNNSHFWNIFSNYPLNRLESKFKYIKNNNLLLQNKLNLNIWISDIDFSVYDKTSWTLLVFESKNFIDTHSLHDTFQKESILWSPISKWKDQLVNKIIPYINSWKLDVKKIYWENIIIKQIFGFVITWSDFIWINSDLHDNIRVITIDKTLEILDKYKNNIEKIFENIDILADYKYYLSKVKIEKQEDVIISIPFLSNDFVWIEKINLTVPLFKAPS